MSNEAKMTLEERMVQTLKSDHLMKLVGDEDAITELVTRAIREALFQPKRVPRSYGGFDETDSIVVREARNVAQKAAEKVAAELCEELMKSDSFRDNVREAMVRCLPQIMFAAFDHNARNLAMTASNDALNMLRQLPR